VNGKSKPGGLVLVLFLFLLLSVSLVAAQYTTTKTTNFTIGSDRSFSGTQSSVGVSYLIAGAAGANGSVTAELYSGNPYPTASVPSGVSLVGFVEINFDIAASAFTKAAVTLNYTASEVQNIKSPYMVYKYVPSSNSYVALSSAVDANAKTITVTLNSLSDPLLAIGGAKSSSSSGISTAEWTVIVISVLIVLVLAVFVVTRMRHNPEAS